MKSSILFFLVAFGSVESYAQTAEEKGSFQIVDRWEKVNVANFESETKGLTKIDFVTVKATGTTGWGSASRVHNRAMRKLKMATALLGGNLVYLKDETLVGNGLSSLGLPRTQLFGTVYSKPWSDTSAVIKQLKDARDYAIVAKIGILNNQAKIHNFKTGMENIVVDSYFIENNFVYVNVSRNKGNKKWVHLPEKNENRNVVRVVGVVEGGLVLAYKDGTSVYNIRVVKR